MEASLTTNIVWNPYAKFYLTKLMNIVTCKLNSSWVGSCWRILYEQNQSTNNRLHNFRWKKTQQNSQT